MNFLIKSIALFISIPAHMKGMKFGHNSYIAPGYDWLFVNMRNISVQDNVMIGRDAWMQTIDNGIITIKSGTHIGRRAVCSSVKSISIGRGCLISYDVSILDHTHIASQKVSVMNSGITKGKSIKIGNNCFIGAHSFIMPGVRLGNNSVVGANSVVTKSFPARSIIAGNPAKNIHRK